MCIRDRHIGVYSPLSYFVDSSDLISISKELKLKDGRFYCHIERDDIVDENLTAVQWYLWDWVCGEYGYERGEKPITNKPTKPITKKPTTLDKLVDVLTTFCDEEGLEPMCADDLLHTSWHELDDDQRKILSLYSELFTVVASREGES